MKLVRWRRDARWLPSRFHFALFRLFAFFRLRGSRPEPSSVILVVDRQQSAIENHLVAVWVVVTVASLLAPAIAGVIPPLLAPVVAIVIAGAVIQLLIVLSALALAPLWSLAAAPASPDRSRFNSGVVLLVIAAGATHALGGEGWARLAGAQYLLLIVLNGLASLVMFLLRNSVRRLEERIGGPPSAP